MDNMPPIEWVKLIPADSIPVFCFPESITNSDLHHASDVLLQFFGERKCLVVRGCVEVCAIADSPSVSAEGASWAMEGAQL